VFARVFWLDDPASREILQQPALAILTWVEGWHKLFVRIRHADTPDASYVTLDERTPIWQLTDGWWKLEEGRCWIAPRATARLGRPAGATRFEAVVRVTDAQMAAVGHCEFSVRLNGEAVGTANLTRAGVQTLCWPVKPGAAGRVDAEFRAEPGFHEGSDKREFGIAIMSFGFQTGAGPSGF
jgi:hypothetical protein